MKWSEVARQAGYIPDFEEVLKMVEISEEP